jgi:hypothetical protein
VCEDGLLLKLIVIILRTRGWRKSRKSDKTNRETGVVSYVTLENTVELDREGWVLHLLASFPK